MTSKQLIEYVVLDIEPADHSKGRFALARAEVHPPLIYFVQRTITRKICPKHCICFITTMCATGICRIIMCSSIA